ncbi:helix-turn-helix domain-containing protein [Acetobacterium woodii]|uniref:helix-turn-helix domain-containing protein n=1 Tax=Acetobacterium woodii TaxID=33952 RepID=UPI0005A24ECF
MITYKKMFHLLVDREMKDVDLRKKANISAPTMTKLRNDKIVQTDTIDKLCKALQCQPGDIMEYLEEEN